MRWCGVWTVICVLTMSILETFVHCYCSRSGGVVQICFPIAMKQREGLGKSYSEKSHVIKRSRHTWPTVRAAFDFYKRLYGNLDVPYNFSMPPSWNHPQQLQNMKLGHITSRIRTRGDFLEHHQELSSMGFQWAVKSTSLFEDTIEALIEYNCTYGNMNVPVKYCIQNSTLFSRQFWGMKLGRRLDHIRQGSYSSPLQRARLVNIGLNVSKLRDRRGIEVILDALRSYKNVHGHLQVPSNFVVPPTSDYPQHTHHLKLGSRVSHIRNRGDFSEHRAALDEIGFVWAAWRDTVFQDIFYAMQRNYNGIP